jgi:hypothetical protein
VNADRRGDRMFWLLLIGLCIGIALMIWRWPRFSLAVAVALAITTALYKFGIV